MVIQHSKKLLEQLGQIENQIQKWETLLDLLNTETDREEILKFILKKEFLEKEIKSNTHL